MPELPEVQTTVNGLNKKVKGAKIIDVWSIYNSPYYKSKENIKDPQFFTEFKNRVIGAKIINAERRAKNILINLDNKETILIHMKMTGHLMFGKYTNTSINSDKRNKTAPIKSDDPWKPTDTDNQALSDPFNSHIRLVFSLEIPNSKKGSKNANLVLSDTRKFAKVTVIKTDKVFHSPDLSHLGPEPLNKEFNFEIFKEQINKKPNGKIKTVLLDQTIIAGIGNIYSDEALWLSNIHPESIVRNIPLHALKKLFQSILTVLTNGIDFGGDSMSDYRNIDGEKGSFQEQHNVYRKKGELCGKTECKKLRNTETSGTKETFKYTIKRIMVGGRSTHYCENHQTKY